MWSHRHKTGALIGRRPPVSEAEDSRLRIRRPHPFVYGDRIPSYTKTISLRARRHLPFVHERHRLRARRPPSFVHERHRLRARRPPPFVHEDCGEKARRQRRESTRSLVFDQALRVCHTPLARLSGQTRASFVYEDYLLPRTDAVRSWASSRRQSGVSSSALRRVGVRFVFRVEGLKESAGFRIACVLPKRI